MGRRRSKWKDRKQESDRGSLLLQYAKTGACDSLDELLADFEKEMLAQENGAMEAADVQEERTNLLQLTQDHTGSTALHLAASEGHCEMIRKLLQLGAGEIHLGGGRKKYAKTPLQEAATTGHLEACRLLVEYGFLVDCHTTRGRTPLMYAVKGNYLDVAQYLVEECRANVNEKNEMGVTPVYIASQDGLKDMAKLLVKNGADVNLVNRTRHSPLHEAIAGGHLAVAEFLLSNGADKHVVDAMGVTIWHEAAGNGSVALLDLLVKYDVSLRRDGHEQVDSVMARHPFHYAAVEGKTEFIQTMLDRNLVDINMVDADSCSAIYYAAANGHSEVLQALLERGGDANLASIRRSPLHCATEWRRVDCVKLLLVHGASTDAVDKNGLTPRAIAEEKHFDELVAIFDSHK
jgi:ankyrin repeat protein